MIRFCLSACAFVLAVAAPAFDDAAGMCFADREELSALASAEKAQSRGDFVDALQRFRALAASAPAYISARAAFRIAEIEEELMWSQNHGHDLRDFLKNVRSVRNAFLNVTKSNDAFWSRRAAYRVMLLMDDVLERLPKFALSQQTQFAVSPFDVVFSHHLSYPALNRIASEIESERDVLEQTLLAGLKDRSVDGPLYAALQSRAHEGTSPYFGDFISPPWDNNIPQGTIIRKAECYYRIEKDERVTPVTRVHALLAMREALKHFEAPIPFAFALAQLADEKQTLSEDLIVAGLQSPDESIRLAALYAAQKSPSHGTTSWLLALLPKRSASALFATAQRTLFGEKERLVLALASHFALGRHSKVQILASGLLRGEEKAWLEHYVKTRNEAAAGAWTS